MNRFIALFLMYLSLISQIILAYPIVKNIYHATASRFRFLKASEIISAPRRNSRRYMSIELNEAQVKESEQNPSINHSIAAEDKDSCLIQLKGETNTVKLYQRTTGKVPRPYLSTTLLVSVTQPTYREANILIEEGIRWYLDSNGRIARLQILAPSHMEVSLARMGFTKIFTPVKALDNKELSVDLEDYNYFIPNPAELLTYCTSELSENIDSIRKVTLHDICGRLYHDSQNFDAAINQYTNALIVNNNVSSIFRNLGSAYHAAGNMQMAFASYQQAIQLDSSDALVYLKLAFFYEDFARRDWPDAEAHAATCYEHYLKTVDNHDSAILARYANLLTSTNSNLSKAIEVYDLLTKLQPNDDAAYFNKAHAHIKLKQYNEAISCLQATIRILRASDRANSNDNKHLIAAEHMLSALDEKTSSSVSRISKEYVTQLFDEYAASYDQHTQKLFYSAPRTLRLTLADIYKSLGYYESYKQSVQDNTLQRPVVKEIDCVHNDSFNSILGEHEHGDHSCNSHRSFMNNQLNILDLGCGTGLAGAWLKDYAQELVGVDISEEMLKVNRKKGLYQTLIHSSIEDFLQESMEANKDLIIAVEVFPYIGELHSIINQSLQLVKPGGLLAFTVESLDAYVDSDKRLQDDTAVLRGFKLMKTGRFAHSHLYINNIIESINREQSIKILECKPFAPRLEEGDAVEGYLFVLQKQN